MNRLLSGINRERERHSEASSAAGGNNKNNDYYPNSRMREASDIGQGTGDFYMGTWLNR